MAKEKKEELVKWTPPKPGQKIKIIDREYNYQKPEKDEKKGKK